MVNRTKSILSQFAKRLVPAFEFTILVVVSTALFAMTQCIYPNLRLVIWHVQYSLTDIFAHIIPLAAFAQTLVHARLVRTVLFAVSSADDERIGQTTQQRPQQNAKTPKCGTLDKHVGTSE